MMGLFGIGNIIEGVGKIADDLFTSDEERLKVSIQEKMIDADLVRGQLAVNTAEAKHKSIFVAGWRPFIGWIGGLAMAYQFIMYPLLIWGWAFLQAKGMVPATLSPPPVIDAKALWVLLSGMMGVAGMRSFDKAKGVQTDKITGN